MTTSKVAQMASLLSSPELPNIQKQSQGTGFAFGAFLSQTAGGGNKEMISAENLQKPDKGKAVNQAAYEKESAKSGYRENPVSRNSGPDSQNKLPEDAPEKLKAFDKQVKEILSEKLGVTEEEITQQMEAMGITALDLIVPSQLAELVMGLTGGEDIAALLLDENFQQILSQITALPKLLAGQLNLTPEQMEQLMEQMKLMASQEAQEDIPQDAGELSITQTEEQPSPQPVMETDSQTAEVVLKTAAQPQEETVLPNEAPRESAESKEQAVANVQVQEESEGQEEMEEGAAEGKSSTDLSQESKGSEKTENRQTHVSYQTTTQTVGQGQTVEVTQTVVQTRVNVEDIFRQVSQMTRVFVSQAESSIEMQLNPANLGKVYLQVVSREGVITAQIAAQNEAVKEALESQVAMLKENMNQQGMKVEAIEVTIASHEFERNLEENQQNAASQQQEEQAQKSGRRNINLNSLDELEGLMTEEENLAAKIMTEQGNSMDVTV